MSHAGNTHTLTGRQIKELVAGYGGEDVIEVLRAGQFSRFLLSLTSILEIAPAEKVEAATDLIQRAQEVNEPASFEALTYPHISVWGWVCLERLLGIVTSESADDHLGHFSAIAVSVAYRSGVEDFEIAVPLRHGGVVLPGLGRAIFGPDELFDTALARSQEGVLSISYRDQVVEVPQDPASDATSWEAVRVVETVSNGLKLTVTIDDVDPYRQYYASAALVPPADHLDDVGFKNWRASVEVAWATLTENHFEYAVGIAAGMRALIPMSEDVYPRHDHAPHAFGAIALTNLSIAMEDMSPSMIAFSILEEFQRSKLGVLDYLFPLHNATHDENIYFAPWSDVPRSLRELFESFYALPAVARHWKIQTQIANSAEDRLNATLQWLRWQGRVEDVRMQLLESGDLTDFGISFVKASPKPSFAETEVSFSPEVRRLARSIEIDYRICWRLQNLQPDADSIERLAQMWIATKSCPRSLTITSYCVPQSIVSGWKTRWQLSVVKMTDPTHFMELSNDIDRLQAFDSIANMGDISFVNRENEEASVRYLMSINENIRDREVWAGYVMAYGSHRDLAALMLSRFPEVVFALCIQIDQLSGEKVDPADVAHWLAPLLLRHDEWKVTAVVDRG